MKQNWEKSPDMKDIQGNFSQISQISKMEKILNFHFLMINKFQWVTKHIEFFFGNFHIWYIAHTWPVSTFPISQNWQ